MDLKWVISEEERSRHDALFYSQKPQDRYLSGEQARSLFIRSKLPLPELSKIWKLADVTRNNKLDIAEFAVAMHLIQSRLKGTDIPLKLPETLSPTHLPHVNIPIVTEEEKAVYEKAFMWKNNEKTGYIDAETARSILTGSELPEDVLARIWNLADIDRDGKLSLEEFFIALHLARFSKQGNSLEGSVNARSILSQQLTEECYESKKLRLAEVQTEKRKRLSLKEKLCHEIAGDVEEETMAHKIQDELDQVEREVYVLEKEENELRRTLQQLKDKSKRESFKPFDRSFLIKRQTTGEDIFRGASKKYKAPLSDKDEEIQKLWRENGDLSDFGVSISEEPSIPELHTANIRQDQFGRTVIELSENHAPSSSNSSETSSGSSSPATNGVSNGLDTDRSHSDYSNNIEELNQRRDATSESRRTEDQFQDSNNETEKKSLDHDVQDNKGYFSMNGSSPSHSQPTVNVDLPSESKQLIDLESKSVGDSTSDKRTMNGNKTDDEKTSSLQMPSKNDAYITDRERETSWYNPGEISTKPSLVEETVLVATAPTAESSVTSRMDGLLLNLDEDEGLLGNQARTTDDAKLSNTGGTSPRSLTQEELIPFVLEEKKRKDEERAKQRELDDEMRRKARRELDEQGKENKRMAEQRRVTFEEERRKLEHQVSLAQERQDVKKAPLSKTEAGRVIEQELEEQRIREELTRIEIEKMKEKERAEMEKQKLKHTKKDEHPSAFQNKDLVQKPIFDEKKDFLDGVDFGGLRISSKRGSVIDLSESDGGVKDEVEKRPVENRPVQKPVHSQQQPPRQPQPQAQSQTQPVIRRTKDTTKAAVNRKAENRKSFVELEIERQKAREEEAQKEAEVARRIQAKKQMESSKGAEMQSDEIKAKEHSPRETLQTNGLGGKTPSVKKQTKVETVPQTNTANVESPPTDEVDAKQRMQNGADSGKAQSQKVEDDEARRKRQEQKELFRQMQEKEKRRREAQKADLDKIRKEVDQKEAEELMRLKLLKEEEKKTQREHERRLATERHKDSAERQQGHEQEAASRKTSFAAHKLILEQRVLKALEESKRENTLARRRASSFEHATEGFDQDEPATKEEANEEYTSAGVKLRKANFEKAGVRKDHKEELQRKRYSLNIEHTRRLNPSPEDGSLRNSQPGSVGKKTPFSADDVFGKGAQAQMEREEELLRRVGGKVTSNDGKLSKAKSLGDLSLKKGKNDDRSSYNVLRRVSFNGDQTDSADGLPTFSDSRIAKELEEQRMREEVVKKEITEREKKHRLEEEKKKTIEVPAGKKETSLNEIKRNPLPSKIQVKKPPSNRDSLTHSMATHWETVLHSQEGSDIKDKTERKKSRIEIEKEEERRREEELQKEREIVMLEIKRKEEASKSEKQRKIEEENEKKRKAQEEKEKRQQRTSAMKSLFEKMGGKK